MKKIVIGSLNKTKTNAIKAVFKTHNVIAKDVPSGVSVQPIGDEETMRGAINRATCARKVYPNTIGIGLEGGVMFLQDELYLCNWGALQTVEGKIHTASGARIRLPHSFIRPLKNGIELSELMDKYTNESGVRNYEGAIGIFTNGQVLRHEMFTHIATLLKGQYTYWKKNQ